jgi:hypothetical protein
MPNSRFPRGSVNGSVGTHVCRWRLPSALLFLTLFGSTTLAQRGAQTAPAPLDQLVESSATILRGHVISTVVEPHPQFANLQTVLVTISVGKVLKGEASPTYTFRQFIWDPRDVAESAGYRKAGELLLFLNPVSEYGLTSPVGLEQGRFRVTRDAKGRAFAVNGRANFGLFDQVSITASARGVKVSRQAEMMMAKPGGPVSLETLEETVAALAGKSQ